MLTLMQEHAGLLRIHTAVVDAADAPPGTQVPVHLDTIAASLQRIQGVMDRLRAVAAVVAAEAPDVAKAPSGAQFSRDRA